MDMTFHWTLQQQHGIARLELGGSLSAHALADAHRAATSLAGWRTDLNLLVVLNDNVRTGSLTLHELETHRDFMLEWNRINRTHSSPRTAMICGDDLKRSIARLWSMVTDADWPIEIAIFADSQAAIAWLNEGRDSVAPPTGAASTRIPQFS